MDILKKISDAIVEMDEDEIESFIVQAVGMEEVELKDIYSTGLNAGMVRAIELYEKKQYDIPEVIVCADVLNKGLSVLKKYGTVDLGSNGKILLAVVEGDTHEIGKNIVKIMLEAAGYEVVDIGVNKTTEEIIDTAVSEKVQIIGLSSMMTTTRGAMKELIDRLDSMDLEERPSVIVGGGSITESYSEDIDADGYSPNAPSAVKLIKKILEEAN